MSYSTKSQLPPPIAKRDPDADYTLVDYSSHVAIDKKGKRTTTYNVPHHLLPEWLITIMAVLDIAADHEGWVNIENVGLKHGTYYRIPKQS